MENLTRIDAIVHGDVQRVGYRYIVQDTARRLGVKGYVQNMPDGTVRIAAEAVEDVIQKFIEALRIKEPPIDVENIHLTYSKPSGEFQLFAIKYGDPTEEMAEGFGAGLKYVNVSRYETRQGFQNLGSKIDEGFGTLRTEMKGEFQTLRTEMKEGFETLGTETKEGFQTLRTEMKEGFGTLRAETKEGFQTLGTEMKEGFGTLGGEIKAMHEDMNRNFQEMSGKYDAISQNLGEAVKIIQEESTKTRNELIRAVDNLSRLVEEFLESRRRKENISHNEDTVM